MAMVVQTNEILPLNPRWDKLLGWLKSSHGMSLDNLNVQARQRPGAGYGLYTTCPIEPSNPLFTIPASALPNILTLSPHYARSDPPLTAVQLISLHLALHRPKPGKDSSDPLFGPYISILPEDFTFHPLSWLREQSRGLPCVHAKALIDGLPISVMDSLNRLSNRFETDWKRVSGYLQDNPSLYELLHSNCADMEIPFLWAWLNVNTRCVYYRVREARSDPDNISLCPVLDFANHTASGPHMVSMSGNNTQDTYSWMKPGDMTFVSPAEQMRENEEMYLVYGGHSNKSLFVEYGFIVPFSVEALVNGQFFGEVDVQSVVEGLFGQRGKTGEWMKEILMREGYWGDWTMQSTPAPAHPSFRLITALRLYHGASKDTIRPWRETILGMREEISKENEGLWRKTLVEICERVESEAEKGVKGALGKTIEQLWMEELWVARGVRESVEGGVLF